MTLPLLLIGILALFLLRVPMAFAILGPSIVYLLVEDYSLHLGVRLVMQGINSWPLLAVPLFILVGIVATRTEIADRLYDAALLLLGWQKGAAVAGHNALFWILVNGIPSALGAIAAWAHPLTVIAAFVAAPLTSLTPVIGAGYVTAFIQAYLRPPSVRELQSVSDDVRVAGQWWRNKLLRIFLAFILPGIGSMIGTWIGGYEIVSNLFK